MIDFRGNRFVAGEGFSVRARADAHDLEENLRWIREARRQADWLVVSLHWHEFGGQSLRTAQNVTECEEAAEFVTDFAHRAIDAGADLFVGHGPHVPLGVEIYKAKPIFYSLGNFIFQNETVKSFPADAYERFGLDERATPADWWDARTDHGKKGHPANPLYWENFVAVCEFPRYGNLARRNSIPSIRVMAARAANVDDRYWPTGAVAERVLNRMQRLSRLYGTEVRLQDGIGVIGV